MPPPNDALVLISGAGLPPWIWDDVRSRLPEYQPTEVAPRPRANATLDSPTLDSYAQAALDALDGDRCTVVGHSVGAIIGLRMHQISPERIDGVLAVSGVIPGPQGSFVSAMPFPNRLFLAAALRLVGARPPDKAIRKGLCSGLDATTTERLVDEFTVESVGLFRDHLDPTPYPTKTGYVHTTADGELPPKLQARFAERLPSPWTSTLQTGHLPMLEDPMGLAEAISSFLAG